MKPFNFTNHYRKQQQKSIDDYKHGIVENNWKGASKHARIIRDAKPPKPL